MGNLFEVRYRNRKSETETVLIDNAMAPETMNLK